MANLGKAGKTSIYIDLSVARSGVYKSIKGRYVKVVASSDATARINISVGENVDTDFQELRRNGSISDGDGFSGVYISNDAQAGKWVRIIITKGKHDYDVENPSLGVVEGIVDPVTVENAEDANTQAKLDAILGMMQNRNDKRAGLTDLTGASFATVNGASVVIVAGAANVNGVIIRTLMLRSTTAQCSLALNGNTSFSVTGDAGNIEHLFIKDIFVPAGVEISGISAVVGSPLFVWYEVM